MLFIDELCEYALGNKVYVMWKEKRKGNTDELETCKYANDKKGLKLQMSYKVAGL